MLALKDLIRTPLYKEFNVCFHPQWSSLFALHMQLSSNLDVQFNTEDNLNANNFEEYIEDPLSETLVHDCDKIQDFNNMLSIALGEEYSPIGIF